ncbi:olfactory receptor 6B1-like [Alligator mississippiensis]|uniref:olfactory receptor 6B1-like n=1 Tax=Alligator mississippiensis TaxID=8496 RepID=UPI002877EBCE|nr:olfactory receptor 6B1-like [Alligator mississippiensis]
MAGNFLIIVLVVTDQHLHTPMYFFLGNLSFLETCYTSTLLPRMLATFLTGDRTISITGCLTQFYFFGFLVTSECLLLSSMSFDRYLAICKPLHYATLMNHKLCIILAAGSWITALLVSAIITFFMAQSIFCGPNEINHFFCDFTPVIKLSCSDTYLVEFVTTLLASLCTFPSSLLTLMSYACIITTILGIPSTTGKKKAFSTCSSHLIVVTIYYGTLMVVYISPRNDKLKNLNKVLSLFYTVLTPLANPLIYSLRNKEVKEALKKTVIKPLAFTGT